MDFELLTPEHWDCVSIYRMQRIVEPVGVGASEWWGRVNKWTEIKTIVIVINTTTTLLLYHYYY